MKHDNLEKLSVINALDLRTTSSPLTTHLFAGLTRQFGIPTFRAQAWWPDESSSWDRTLTPVVPVNWPGSCLLRAQFCIWKGKGHQSYKSLMLHTLLSFLMRQKTISRIFSSYDIGHLGIIQLALPPSAHYWESWLLHCHLDYLGVSSWHSVLLKQFGKCQQAVITNKQIKLSHAFKITLQTKK